MKPCTDCGASKPLDQYHPRNGRCIPCFNVAQSAARWKPYAADWEAALAHAERLGIAVDPEGFSQAERKAVVRLYRSVVDRLLGSPISMCHKSDRQSAG